MVVIWGKRDRRRMTMGRVPRGGGLRKAPESVGRCGAMGEIIFCGGLAGRMEVGYSYNTNVCLQKRGNEMRYLQTDTGNRGRMNLVPRDRQMDRPLGFCLRCGRERYGPGRCRCGATQWKRGGEIKCRIGF